MQVPALSDTIVAVSTGWQPAALGIVRLSGPDAFALVGELGPVPPATAPAWTDARVRLDDVHTLPATAYWFRAPRSYTGQDLVELHVVGCLPLLRALSARLLECGARRALPGEFTARAFLNGRLAARQVAGVLNLMQAQHAADVREAARLARGDARRRIADLRERVTRLLALIEAGIDFVDEDDVRFIAPAEVVATLDGLLADLDAVEARSGHDPHLGRPHVALGGLPNAGKSTLFNALVGYERALVSPVLGTTRDVLSAEVEFGGLAAVLQDCAGLGSSADDLELASHLASERAAQQADLVLWVHAADTRWDTRETTALERIGPAKLILVVSKADLASVVAEPAPEQRFVAEVRVSASRGTGLQDLRAVVSRELGECTAARSGGPAVGELRVACAALRRAKELAATSGGALSLPELICVELRTAFQVFVSETFAPLDERLLDRIYAEFCVGK